jgi:hypothetical protein
VPRTWWRRIHFLSFPLYVVASVHLFAAGTDSANPVAQWMVVVISTLVVFLTGIRVLAAAKPRPTTSRVPAAARAATGDGPAPVPTADASTPAAPLPASGDLLPNAPSARPAVTATLTLDRPAERLRAPTVDERAARIRAMSRAASARIADGRD